MNQDQASHFARLALGCIQRELPNGIQHTVTAPDDVRGPRALHPAFYGCFDWHSAVHGHWMLVRLLRRWPGLAEAAAIRAALDANLTAANLAAEVAYFTSEADARKGESSSDFSGPQEEYMALYDEMKFTDLREPMLD